MLNAMGRVDFNVNGGFVMRVVVRLFGGTEPQNIHAILYGFGDGSLKDIRFVNLLISAVTVCQQFVVLSSSGYSNLRQRDLALRNNASA